jgi:hypothetical protein
MRRRFALLAALALAALTLALTSMPRPRALAQARPPAGDDEGWRDDVARLAVEIQDQMDQLDRLRATSLDPAVVAGRARADVLNAEEELKVAQMALTEYTDGIFPIELSTAEGKIRSAKAGLATAKEKIRIIEQGLRQRPNDPLLLLARLDLPADPTPLYETLIKAAEGSKEQLVRYTKPTQVKTLQAKVVMCEAKVQAMQASLKLAEMKRAQAERTGDQTQPLPQEREASRAIIGALSLEKQWQAARAANKPADEVKKLEDRARAQYAEARQAWRDARLIRARQRLGFRN